MQFDVNEWRKIYDKVQALGASLNNANGALEFNEKYDIEIEITELLIKNNDYLDSCGMKDNVYRGKIVLRRDFGQ